ncbi:MAG: hypothetical protein LBT89_12520 [Planctomycetaceae bacterium]|jgi:hypothetical protein|nr:hypothetical protein [Planctomycetaceae bacterium]
MNVLIDDKHYEAHCQIIRIGFIEPIKKFMNIRMEDGIAKITVSDSTVFGSYNLEIAGDGEGKHDYSLPIE